METEFVTYTVSEWFQTLDYEYMVLHVIVCYGLYFSDNMKWITEWLSPIRKKGRIKAVWITGGFLALLEIIRFLPLIGEGGLDYQKFFSIFHSFILIQVFVDPMVQTFHSWLQVFKKTLPGGDKEEKEKKKD